MDKKMLQDTVKEFKRATALAGCKVDYAITNPDSYGCEGSDVHYNIEKKYGDNAKGIWANHFNRGYNASDPIEKVKEVYFNHNLTEEQVDVFYNVFGKHYNIFPDRAGWTDYWCPSLYEKDTPVWAVSRKSNADDIRPSQLTTSIDSVVWHLKRPDAILDDGDAICVQRIF